MVAATSKAAAVRRIVPTLPGSWIASSTSMRTRSPTEADASERSGISAIARTPCGDSVSDAERNSRSETSVIWIDRSSIVSRTRARRSLSGASAAAIAPTMRNGDASSSSTARTPSATNRRWRSRAFRRCKSRARESSFMYCEVPIWNGICPASPPERRHPLEPNL